MIEKEPSQPDVTSWCIIIITPLDKTFRIPPSIISQPTLGKLFNFAPLHPLVVLPSHKNLHPLDF